MMNFKYLSIILFYCIEFWKGRYELMKKFLKLSKNI